MQNTFLDAIRVLKRSIYILMACDAKLASAAITMKLIDSLEAAVLGNLSQSISDIWMCTLVTQRILYESLSAALHKSADITSAKQYGADEKWMEATEAYWAANIEITNDTKFADLFADLFGDKYEDY